MKKLLKNSIAFIALLTFAGTFTACTKDNNPTPKPTESKHWIKVYKDVILGNQDNHTYGQFFKSQTGEAIALENAKPQAKYLSMMFFTGYGHGTYLTFPGDGFSTGDLNLDENRLFHQPGLGIEFWPQGEMNSGELTLAIKGYVDGTTDLDYMTASEFNALADNPTWENFIAKYKECNDGSTELNFVANYTGVDNGDIFLIQLNNTVRAFLRVKNVVPDGGAAGGNIKFDIIIEGSDDYADDSSTEYIQPSKD